MVSELLDLVLLLLLRRPRRLAKSVPFCEVGFALLYTVLVYKCVQRRRFTRFSMSVFPSLQNNALKFVSILARQQQVIYFGSHSIFLCLVFCTQGT